MAGPTYTYTSMTPNAPDAMNGTQPLIEANFQAIQELFQVNHVSWSDTNASTNLGAHNFLSLPNQSPIPAATNTAVTMYTEVTGSPNPCELFIEYANGITSQISNQPAPTYGTGTSSGNASQGYCTFPTGVSIRWGTGTAPNGASTLINFTSPPYITGYFLNGPVAPTSVGCPIPTACSTTPGVSSSQIYLVFIGGTGTVHFNYFVFLTSAPY